MYYFNGTLSTCVHNIFPIFTCKRLLLGQEGFVVTTCLPKAVRSKIIDKARTKRQKLDADALSGGPVLYICLAIGSFSKAYNKN